MIGGSLRGKRLKSFKGRKIRPTSDRVKEALFNIVGNHQLEGAKVLDLFAGTGNLGIEALSRGASNACFVEKELSSLNVLKENLKLCSLVEQSEIIPADVKKAVSTLDKKGGTFDIIFIDPPYGKGLADETLKELGKSIIAEESLVVAEHDPKDPIEERYGKLFLKDQRRYGDTSLSFFIRLAE